MSDLVVTAFRLLRMAFFEDGARPKPFRLRDKRNTQDDPFDEHVCGVLSQGLVDATCVKAAGPLITPDLVLMREELCAGRVRAELRDDLNRIVGIEVKKLDRTPGGAVARASGLDYNTTPPCGTIRVYDAAKTPLDIRGFYLFVCLQGAIANSNGLAMTAMVLCDGNLLNADFAYYLSVVGTRTKSISLGTYHNGMDRARPMVVFPNPLGAKELDHRAVLIHPAPHLSQIEPNLLEIYNIRRTRSSGERSEFTCYAFAPDVPAGWEARTLVDPFPTPTRQTTTAPRGRFLLPFKSAS